MTITDLLKDAHGTSKEHGWWDDYFTATEFGPAYNMAKIRASIPEKLCLIHSEVSEALEDYRVGKLFEVPNDKGKPEGLPTELADIVIRVADLSVALGIDLEATIARKLAYNKTRSHRHGGKVC